MKLYYDPQWDEIYLFRQRMRDEWVFEVNGFYSPQYTHINPILSGLIYVGDL